MAYREGVQCVGWSTVLIGPGSVRERVVQGLQKRSDGKAEGGLKSIR